ncbi:MAG: RES family NAD+ phosphorylase [Paracoccaceae bacterium]
MRYIGSAFRALNPVWAAKPLSGEGARLHGGRFNPKGTPALYTALDVQTAIAEANQIGQAIQPTTLVEFAVDVEPIFDATDAELLAGQGMTQADLASDNWREAMRHAAAPTQQLVTRLMAQGMAGLIAPSFARNANPGARNLILWHWGPALPTRVTLTCDEARITRAYPA